MTDFISSASPKSGPGIRTVEALLPLALVGILAIILLPPPGFVIDMLLSLNLALSMVILLATVYITHPLELSVFPSMLLLVTFFRLALNIATTRLILSNAGEQGLEAAGGMVRAFGVFVAGGSPLVGFVIFCLLVVIQFVVITRGATRIAEVAARFRLDGLPGKQMSIDSDLSSGLITSEQAGARREELSRQVDFYGAMDGASRWIRGDAIAALVIILVNILGGLGMGLLYYRMQPAQALAIYTRLTVGDGLVTQIPAVIIATAAGLLITRASSPAKLTQLLISQLILKPRLLAAAAICLVLLSFLPVPKLPIFILASLSAGGAWLAYRHSPTSATKITSPYKEAPGPAEPTEAPKPAATDSQPVQPSRMYPLELEIGYQLVPLAEGNLPGSLAARLSKIRKELAVELGFAIPPARIRDNLKLPANKFRIKLRGVPISQGTLPGDRVLVVGESAVGLQGDACQLAGVPKPSCWLSGAEPNRAEVINLEPMMPVEVLELHLRHLLRQRAHQLLTRAEVDTLLERLKSESPSLVEELVPARFGVGQVHQVLRNLLEEGIPIHDLETILEALSDCARGSKDTDALTRTARARLGELITSLYAGSDGRLYVLTLEPSFEDLLNGALTQTETGSALVLPPSTAAALLEIISTRLRRAPVPAEARVVILCSSHIRKSLRRLLEKSFPELGVLGYNEIAPSTKVELVGMIALPEGKQLQALSQEVSALANWPEGATADLGGPGPVETESMPGVADDR